MIIFFSNSVYFVRAQYIFIYLVNSLRGTFFVIKRKAENCIHLGVANLALIAEKCRKTLLDDVYNAQICWLIPR